MTAKIPEWIELSGPDARGRREFLCDTCGCQLWAIDQARIHHACTVRVPLVGVALLKLIKSLGISRKPGCGCGELAKEMNALGPDGCRAKRDELATKLREKAASYGVIDWANAAARAALLGLAGKVSWLDPFPGLIDVAIARADAVGTSGG